MGDKLEYTTIVLRHKKEDSLRFGMDIKIQDCDVYILAKGDLPLRIEQIEKNLRTRGSASGR